jgi:hypothetical protein
MEEIVMTSVVVPQRELFPLPDAELVFGLGGGRRHAVTHDAAVRAIGDGLICDARAVAVCDRLVGVVPKWGPYQRASRYLSHGGVCALCTWIVAESRGETAVEIAAAAPSEQHTDLIAAALGDPMVGVRVLEAIAVSGGHGGFSRFERTERAELLSRAAQHLPKVTVCEDCSDFGGNGIHDEGPCGRVLCLACTMSAGPWAGEYENYTMPECTVEAPCSVLGALCGHYNIALRLTAET